MDPLLDILRCPVHPGCGLLTGERGMLRCVSCGALYPIVNGIPDMLIKDGYEGSFLSREEKQWDAQAPAYEEGRRHDPFYEAGVNAAVEALRPRPGEVILDAACGTGFTIARYYRDDIPIIALDLSMRSLYYLKERFGERSVFIVRGDITTLPFRTGMFSKVLCANGLSQIPDEGKRLQCVQELARVARAGGRVVVTTHNLSNRKKRYGWTKEGSAKSPSGEVQYLYRYEPSEFFAVLSSALQVDRITGCGLPLPYRFKLSPLSRTAERFLRKFRISAPWGNMLVGTCHKKQ